MICLFFIGAWGSIYIFIFFLVCFLMIGVSIRESQLVLIFFLICAIIFTEISSTIHCCPINGSLAIFFTVPLRLIQILGYRRNYCINIFSFLIIRDIVTIVWLYYLYLVYNTHEICVYKVFSFYMPLENRFCNFSYPDCVVYSNYYCLFEIYLVGGFYCFTYFLYPSV